MTLRMFVMINIKHSAVGTVGNMLDISNDFSGNGSVNIILNLDMLGAFELCLSQNYSKFNKKFTSTKKIQQKASPSATCLQIIIGQVKANP